MWQSMTSGRLRTRHHSHATSGAVKPWDPNANHLVRALAVSGSTVYLGGKFNGPNSINGNTPRNRAAAIPRKGHHRSRLETA